MACRITDTTNDTLQSLIEQTGNQSTALRKFLDIRNGEGLNRSVENKEVSEATQSRVQHIEHLIRKLEQSSTEDQARFNEELDRQRRTILTNLRDQAAFLRDSESASDIEEIGMNQLSWAESVANKENPTESEMIHAFNIVDVWDIETVREFLDEDQLKKGNVWGDAYGNLNLKSKDVRNQLIDKGSSLVEARLRQVVPEDVLEREQDIWRAMDVSMVRRMVLDASRSGNQLVQLFDTILKNAKRDAGRELANVARRVNEILEDVDQSKFLQLDEDGNVPEVRRLLNPFSHSYYNRLNDITAAREKRVKKAQGMGEKKQRKEISKAYKGYHAEKRKIDVTVDIRFFTNNNFSTEAFSNQQKYRNFLVDQFGEEEAQTMIDRALRKYDSYLEEKAAQERAIQTLALDMKSQEESMSEFQSRMMREFERENDPTRYLFEQYGEKGNSADEYFSGRKAEQYTIKAPRAKSEGDRTGFYDSRYSDELTDTEREKLEDLRELLHGLMNYLPKDLVNNKGADFLPQVQKNLMEELMSSDGRGAFAVMNDKLIEAMMSPDLRQLREVTVNNEAYTDPFTGKKDQNIPTYFLDQLDNGEASTDIGKVVQMFAGMALHYKHMIDVKPKVDLIQRVFAERVRNVETQLGKPVTNKDGTWSTTNEAPENLVRMMEYEKRALMYKDKREEQELGTFGTAYSSEVTISEQEYQEEIEKLEESDMDEGLKSLSRKVLNARRSKNPAKKRNAAKAVERRHLELEQAVDDGNLSESQYEQQAAVLDIMYTKLAPRKFDPARVLDSLMKWTQLKGMGYNFGSAISNVMYGMTSTFTHAAGGQDFSMRELMSAYRIAMKEVFTPNSKMSAIAQKLDLLFEVTEIEYGKGATGTKSIKSSKYTSPYIFQHKTEFFVQGVSMVAQMLNTKVQTDVGEINLWQAYDNDGHWKTEEYGEKPENWSETSNSDTRNDFQKFRDKSIQVNKILHGNYDPSSGMEIKGYVLGRALMQFRTWMPEGFAWRWMGEYYDQQLGRSVKGRYRSLGAYYNNIAQRGASFQTLFTDAWNKEESNLDEVDVANLRSNIFEAIMWATLGSMMLMMYSSLEEDEDERYATKLMLNKFTQVRKELYFYVSPGQIQRTIKDPVSMMSTFNDFNKAITATHKKLYSDKEYRGKPLWQKWADTSPITTQVPSMMYLMNNLPK